MVVYIRHSAPVSGINLAISFSENINYCLVSRIPLRHQRLRISDAVLVYPTETQENPPGCGPPGRLFLHIRDIPHKFRNVAGNLWAEHRKIINGMFWMLCSGAPEK